MNRDHLQQLLQDEPVELKNPPDFRFTNYAFAQQRLSETPLPQDIPSASKTAVQFHNALGQVAT